MRRVDWLNQCASIRMRRADWLNRWGLDRPLSLGHQDLHLNPTTRVDAVHGPSLRSALSIVACVPVPTRSMHAHPQNCARALHACPRCSRAPQSLSTQLAVACLPLEPMQRRIKACTRPQCSSPMKTTKKPTLHGVLYMACSSLRTQYTGMGYRCGYRCSSNGVLPVTRWANEGVHYCHVSHRPNIAL